MDEKKPQNGSVTGEPKFSDRVYLENLRLAAEVILRVGEEPDALPAPLESELFIFRDRIERELLAEAGRSGERRDPEEG